MSDDLKLGILKLTIEIIRKGESPLKIKDGTPNKELTYENISKVYQSLAFATKLPGYYW
jgi:hypothetical protein